MLSNLIALGVAATTGLTLEISSAQSAVLVAEPIKVVLTWRAAADQEQSVILEDNGFVEQVFTFEVEGPGEVRRIYRECPRSGAAQIPASWRGRAGESRSQTLILVYGGCYEASTRAAAQRAFGALFGVPGQYRFRAFYNKHGLRVESNWISFEVIDPSGEEVDVYSAVREDLGVLGSLWALERIRPLIANHPKSRYLRWLRLQLYEEARYPSFAGAGITVDSRQAPADLALARARAVQELVSEPTWFPFEDEALTLAYRLARAARSVEAIQAATAALKARAPEAAKKLGADFVN